MLPSLSCCTLANGFSRSQECMHADSGAATRPMQRERPRKHPGGINARPHNPSNQSAAGGIAALQLLMFTRPVGQDCGAQAMAPCAGAWQLVLPAEAWFACAMRRVLALSPVRKVRVHACVWSYMSSTGRQSSAARWRCAHLVAPSLPPWPPRSGRDATFKDAAASESVTRACAGVWQRELYRKVLFRGAPAVRVPRGGVRRHCCRHSHLAAASASLKV